MTNEESLVLLDTWVGMSPRDPDPAKAAEAAKVLLPFDDQAKALAYLQWVHPVTKRAKSTCGIVSKARLREGGCRCREVVLPYLPRDGQAIIDIERIAKRHKAWRVSMADLATPPDPGDVVGIEVANPHVLTVTAVWKNGDGDRVHTIVRSADGGQGDGTYIAARERELIVTGSAALVDLPDGVSSRPGYARVIYGRLVGQQVFDTLHLCE